MYIPGRRDALVRAAVGTVLARAAGARLGLGGDELRRGIRVGLVSASAVVAGVAGSAAIPSVRAGMVARTLPQPAWKWLLIAIPFGTVWAEETVYRGALDTLAGKALGPAAGRLVQALVFGLSHISNARDAGEPVLATVAMTGLAGCVFVWLATHSGNLVAPALAHLAINEAGAVTALVVQARFPEAAGGRVVIRCPRRV